LYYVALLRGHIGSRSKQGRYIVNSTIRTVDGTFSVVQFVAGDKLDQLAALLGLTAAQKAKLTGNGDVILVLNDGGKSAD
jgi:hypothetical protein